MSLSPRYVPYGRLIINNDGVVNLFMVDPISIVIWVLAVACFIVTCIPRLNLLPMYSLCAILGVGGIVCSLNEFNAGAIENPTSLVLVVVMVSIVIYSLFYTIMEITPEMKRGKW